MKLTGKGNVKNVCKMIFEVQVQIIRQPEV